ncbi:isoprenylcysteine carboxylmethyltransferase family protein [Patescibacteria group bacterium]|nr:isoprenylcysteine carboxylmethyltransferase family protein [Patescibacteria group bacterium]
MKNLFDIPYSDFVLAILLMILSLLVGQQDIDTIMGIIIFIISIVLWFLAKRQLGKVFQVKVEAKTIIKKGLYSKFRHPIYLFSSLTYLGVLISFWNLYLILPYIALVVFQIVRARREENVFIHRFGNEYREYMKKTLF